MNQPREVSGGATSVRLELPADWMESLAGAELLAAIAQARAER